jgi:hypothetical protein
MFIAENGVMPKQTTVASANICHCCVRPAGSMRDSEEDFQLIYASDASVKDVQALRGIAIRWVASTRLENCLASKGELASFKEGRTRID